MSILGSLQIGRQGLTAAQLGTQVTGNNIANQATPGYSRQTLGLAPTADQRYGNALYGQGVNITGVRRSVDDAVLQRLWSSLSQENGAQVDANLLAQVESAVAGSDGQGLDSQLAAFFKSWSDLSKNPNAPTNKSLVVQSGVALASFLKTAHNNISATGSQIDQNLGTNIAQADSLLSQLASVNSAIINAENGGTAQANNLRDQRDNVLGELGKLVDLSVMIQPSGSADVYIAGVPVLLAGQSRGLQMVTTVTNGQTSVTLQTRNPPEIVPTTSGTIGALLSNRQNLVTGVLTQLDALTAQVIFQVNKAYSSGYSSTKQGGYSGDVAVPLADRTLSFNDPANATTAALPSKPSSGSFIVTVTNYATGASKSVKVNVDLDGVNSAGASGFTNDTTPAQVLAGIAGAGNVTAVFDSQGRAQITAANGYSVGFAEDSSGVLATLGINTYFTGTSATSIDVRSTLQGNTSLLNTGQVIAGVPSDNGVASAIVALKDTSNPALSGQTLSGYWGGAVQGVATKSAAAKTAAAAATTVRQNIEAQRLAVSGVSTDEEAINLLNFQRAYQASARFISVIDQMTQELLTLVK